MSHEIDLRLDAREELWDVHPLITGRMVLPTPPVERGIRQVLHSVRRARTSVGLYAPPLTGKTSCMVAVELALKERYPGCCVALFEAAPRDVVSEGGLIDDLAESLDVRFASLATLTRRRNALLREIYAQCGASRRVFILIDEAQELKPKELVWLKRIINRCVRNGLHVNVVLFGQVELLEMRDDLIREGRSDLHARFTSQLIPFHGIASAEELDAVFEACRTRSSFPENSNWSYEALIWPQAAMRHAVLAGQGRAALQAFRQANPLGVARGIEMEYVAAALSHIAVLTRDCDAARFRLTSTHWKQAVGLSGYAQAQMPRVMERSTRRATRTARGLN